MTTDTRDPKDRVVIFDTTLRDGEQSPGAAMSLQNKVQVAELLDHMGVDVIEAGFPAASQGDFDAVCAVARIVKRATVCGFARATSADIGRAAEAIAPAANGRINIVLAVSDLHITEKLKKSREYVLEQLAASIAHARNFTEDVELIAEDGTRADRDFLCRCVEVAIRSGATTIAIPDTVGYTEPDEYRALFQMLLSRVPGADTVCFGAHCHDDLGMAVANSLAGIKGGARQVECTVNGLGERAGNAALEEIVMALEVRSDILPFWTNVDPTLFQRVSRLVSAVSGFAVPFNKAIVGDNAFKHGSGMHQDGIVKNEATYQIISPDRVGVKAATFEMTKHSGRAGFARKLQELGYAVSGNRLADLFQRFKELADRKKHVYDEDIEALVDEQTGETDRIRLIHLNATAGTAKKKHAAVVLEVDGKIEVGEADGDGPVDAAFNAIKAAVPHEVVLEHYQPRVITGGTDAQVEVRLRIGMGERSAAASGTDPDNVVSSVKAYVRALSKLRNGKAH